MAGAILCASAQHFVHVELLLRGRRSILTLWEVLVRVWAPLGSGCNCVAGAALCASEAIFAWQAQHFVHLGFDFAWQAQHFDCLGSVGARLGAVGLRLQLRGRRNTLCIWSYFCVAGAAL